MLLKNSLSLKIIFTFLILCVNRKTFSQEAEIKNVAALDSLEAILVSGAHDSIICHALFNIIELKNEESDWEPFNKKLDELVQKNLKNVNGKKPAPVFILFSTMVLSNYAGLATKEGEYEKAILLYEKALKISEENKFHKATGILLNGLGLTYRAKGEFTKALEYYKKSLKIREETGTKAEIARALNNIAPIYQRTGQQVEAAKCLERCIKIREEEGDQKGLAVSLNNLAKIYSESGNLTKALEIHNRSLKLRELTGDQKGLAVSLYNIGNLFQQQGFYDKALEYFFKSLKIRERLKDKKGISNSLYSIGFIYENLNQTKKSEEYFEKSCEISKAIGDKEGMARSYNIIATRHSEKGEFKAALENHLKALNLRIEMNDKRDIANSYKNIGTVYFKQKNYKLANEFGTKSLIIGQKYGIPASIVSASKLLWLVHKKQNNYAKALQMFELFVQMRDSINSGETKKSVIKSQLKYEYEKQAAADSVAHSKESIIKSAELEKQRAELRGKRNQQTALFIGLGLVILFSVFMFNRYKITKKQQQIIQLQKNEVENQKLLVDEKQRELLDSIHYAKRIQNAHLPTEMYMFKNLERLKKG